MTTELRVGSRVVNKVRGLEGAVVIVSDAYLLVRVADKHDGAHYARYRREEWEG